MAVADRAFVFFRGTYTRGIYDNMKTAVEPVFIGKERLYNRRSVEVHAYAEKIVIRQDGVVVAEHSRCFGRNETVYDPWHGNPPIFNGVRS